MSSSRLLLALAASASIIHATALPDLAIKKNISAPRYELVASYAGHTFFDHFNTYTGPDPTRGFVNYTDMDFAAQQGLIGFIDHEDTNMTTTYIGVDHKNLAPNGRNSVRLISKQTFDVGSMVVVDLNHIPSQYGLWPAIWMLGSDGAWPASGESDILEYVHKTDYNTITLHASPGCSVANSTAFQGTLLNADCSAGNAALGCSVDAFDQNKLASHNKTMATAGTPFNMQGGGVYVHDWTENGITVWLFPHDDLPTDLIAGNPDPTSWRQKPIASFSGSECDFSTSFRSMQLIIQINFGGDWAGKVWQSSGSANATGVSTADEFIANNPKAFEDSFFDVASIRFFSSNGHHKGRGSETAPVHKRESLTTRTTEGMAAARNLTFTRGSLKPQVATSVACRGGGSGWLLAAGMFALLAFLL